MAPRTRARAARGATVSRNSTPFGELDTTPTSRHMQSPEVPNQKTKSQKENRTEGTKEDEFTNDDIEDEELFEVSQHAKPTSKLPASGQSYPWSETGSQTRRSSPVDGEESQHDIWEFDDDIKMSQFSSGVLDVDALPDTVPLARPEIAADAIPNKIPDTQRATAIIDLSETASTARRSSPYRSDQAKIMWDLDDGDDGQNASDPTSDLQQEDEPPDSVPLDNSCNATPPRSDKRDKISRVVAELERAISPVSKTTLPDKPSVQQSVIGVGASAKQIRAEQTVLDKVTTQAAQVISGTKNKPRSTNDNRSPVEPKIPKKRKQRAKEPLTFDENAQLIQDKELEAKRSPQPPNPSKRVKTTKTAPLAKRKQPATKSKMRQPGQAATQASKVSKQFHAAATAQDKEKPASSRNDASSFREAAILAHDAPDPSGETLPQPEIVVEPTPRKTRQQVALLQTDGSIYLPSSPVSSASSPVAARVKEDHADNTWPADTPSSVGAVEVLRLQSAAPIIVDRPVLVERNRGVQKQTVEIPEKAPAPKQPLAVVDPNIILDAKVRLERNQRNTMKSDAPAGPRRANNVSLARTISVSEQGSPVRTKRAKQPSSEPEGSSNSSESVASSFHEDSQSSSVSQSGSSGFEPTSGNRRPYDRQRLSAGTRQFIDLASETDVFHVVSDSEEALCASLGTERAENYREPAHVRGSLATGTFASAATARHSADRHVPKEDYVASNENTLEEHLHMLTDRAMSNLSSREQVTERIAKMYTENGKTCAKQLHRRFLEEQRALRDRCKTDGAGFLKHANGAKAVVHQRSEEQRTIVGNLETSDSRRGERQSTEIASLRALSRKLAGKLG